MTRDELVQAGRALFGERWQAPLARALGIDLRRMQRYAAGKFSINPGVAADIERLLARHRSNEAMAEIDRLLAEHGAPVEIALTAGRDAVGRQATKLLARALKARGIKVTINPVGDAIEHPAERAAEAALRRRLISEEER